MSAHAIPMNEQKEYLDLLSHTMPTVIHNEEQNEFYLHMLESLLQAGPGRSVAQQEMIALLTVLIKRFEEENYALPKTSPLDTLRFLMDQQGLKQKDLIGVIGVPSVISEIFHGKRELNKEQIRRLSERFTVSPEVFF